MKRNEYILYGLEKHKEIIEEIISYIDNRDYDFDIRLILTEALTNAFKHGNKNDAHKPIYLRAIYYEGSIEFEIQDSGPGFENVVVRESISYDNLLDDYGRGLFLIKSIADKIEFRNSTLIIQKNL
ncbi:ATP-binding protein [Wukongibacter baidiensis]|uniref:ATP-binding protein n=1 Tax=Wukongibacter baidiensis TaxID=1723361 RepID=UPI003D7F9BE5